MKTWKEMYNERLLSFAHLLNHLVYIKDGVIHEAFVEWIGVYTRTYTIIDYNPQFFRMLECFDGWERDKNWNEAMYIEIESAGTLRGCINYFGLDPEELVHLFDLGGFQNIEKYGGKQLNNGSSPKDIAYNIIEFVDKRNKIE